MSEIDHVRNCLTFALAAATQIGYAMHRFDADHAAQENLITALQEALVIAEECRQAIAERRIRSADPTGDER